MSQRKQAGVGMLVGLMAAIVIIIMYCAIHDATLMHYENEAARYKKDVYRMMWEERIKEQAQDRMPFEQW